jgi:hypothetical protein
VVARKEDIDITIDEIEARFARNQIAGAQFFKTHAAVIPGVAVRVREVLGTGILIAKSRAGSQAELAFGERGSKQLGAIQPGDRFVATCPEVHEAMGQVIIACSEISVVGR